MYKSSSQRIFPLIIIIIVVVALVAGLVTVGRYIFGGSSTPSDEQVASDQRQSDLLTVDQDRSVVMTIRGPIVADESYRSYQVKITPKQRSYVVYKGYLSEELSKKEYANNAQAYEQFVYALDKAAFTKQGKNSEEEASDVRGICATGRVYEYELMNSSNVMQRYWTSTCKGSPGTLGASQQQVTNLFSAQIPEEELEYATPSNGLRF